MPHPSQQKQNVGYRCRCTAGASSLPPPPFPKKRFATLSDETLKDKDSEITKKKKRPRREMCVYFGNIWVNLMNFRAGTKFLQRSTLKYVMKRVNLTRKVPLLTPGTALIDY